jgi:elongation factor Ts
MAKLADSGKPPEVLEKIVGGRMRKFFEEHCLTEQEHMVEENNPKVAKALKQLGLSVKRFEYSAISA